jgi:hypothetical protein
VTVYDNNDHTLSGLAGLLLLAIGRRADALAAVKPVASMTLSDAAALGVSPLALQSAYAAAAMLLVLGEVSAQQCSLRVLLLL